MPKRAQLIEFDSSASTAIERIAVNPHANELLVQWRGRPKVYVYRDLPFSALDALSSEAFDFSFGQFALEVKKIRTAVVLSNFPSNVVMYERPITGKKVSQQKDKKPRKKAPGKLTKKPTDHPPPKRLKDCTAQWRQVLDRLADIDTHQLSNVLIPQLQAMHPCLPPKMRPKLADLPEPEPEPGHGHGHGHGGRPSGGGAGAGAGRGEVGNAFSLLDLGHDGDSDDSSSGSHLGSTKAAGMGKPPSAPAATPPPTQSRYLLVRLLCDLTERHRADAVAAQKQKQYAACRDCWVAAYEVANEVSALVLPWSEEMVFGGELIVSMGTLGGFTHDQATAQELVEAVSILAEDTEREKQNAVQRLQTRRDHLEAKLNPLLSDRNTVRESMGEAKWKENPAPKMTYAERRRAMEEELFALAECLEVVARLRIES